MPPRPTHASADSAEGADAAVTRHMERLRRGVRRLDPGAALAASRAGALLIDTRTAAQRQATGHIPGAIAIDRNVLEWRLDPTSPWRIPEVTGPGQTVVVICEEGYASSIAAASLRAIGISGATDLAGGAIAWRDAGLPMDSGPADVRP